MNTSRHPFCTKVHLGCGISILLLSAFVLVFAHVGTATRLDALCQCSFLTHPLLFLIYPPPLLLTASVVLLIAFGPVSILNLNPFSSFIDHSFDGCCHRYTYFVHLFLPFGRQFPPPCPLFPLFRGQTGYFAPLAT